MGCTITAGTGLVVKGGSPDLTVPRVLEITGRRDRPEDKVGCHRHLINGSQVVVKPGIVLAVILKFEQTHVLAITLAVPPDGGLLKLSQEGRFGEDTKINRKGKVGAEDGGNALLTGRLGLITSEAEIATISV